MKQNIPKQTMRRALPDIIANEIGDALSKHKKPVGFNGLFDIVFASLKSKNAVSGGEEMLRLRSYEKLQNMVVKCLVTKVGKEYQTTKRLNEEVAARLSENSDAPGQEPEAAKTPVKVAPAKGSFADTPNPRAQKEKAAKDMSDEELFEALREQVNLARDTTRGHDRKKTREIADVAHERGWNMKRSKSADAS